MTEVHPNQGLEPWKPTPTQIPQDWMTLVNSLTQHSKGSSRTSRTYVLNVRYNAKCVSDRLRLWGLPWQVVVAGYLWECDKEQICRAKLNDFEKVLSHMSEADIYANYINDENLPPLLTPPYRDLGALLLAVVTYYQALQTRQNLSNDQSYTGYIQSEIESIGRTLLNKERLRTE